MTAKDELRQALLNTCSISDEALTLLNSMLDGSGGGGGAMMVERIKQKNTPTEGYDTYTLNHTWNEMKTAMEGGTPVMMLTAHKSAGDEDYELVSCGLVWSESDGYYVVCNYDPIATPDGMHILTTDDPDEAPKYVQEEGR